MTTKRGKKPDWMTSVTQQKPREIGARERMLVLDAVLAGHTLLEAGHAAGVDRWQAEMIATAAGWSDTKRMKAARDRAAEQAVEA